MRIRTIVIAAIATGVTAAVSSSGSLFAKGFWFVFWAVSVCVVLLVARFGRAPEISDDVDARQSDIDPWVDQDGVRHFHRDVFDVENHLSTSDHDYM